MGFLDWLSGSNKEEEATQEAERQRLRDLWEPMIRDAVDEAEQKQAERDGDGNRTSFGW